MFVTKRVYEEASPEDGKRYLVDRLWPRGVKKETAALDGWLKSLAPSDALRKWAHSGPFPWEEFKKRYQDELTVPEARGKMERLREESRAGRVTLLFAAKDPLRNNAVCLKEILEQEEWPRIS
mgnify:CR=1 FL=1